MQAMQPIQQQSNCVRRLPTYREILVIRTVNGEEEFIYLPNTDNFTRFSADNDEDSENPSLKINFTRPFSCEIINILDRDGGETGVILIYGILKDDDYTTVFFGLFEKQHGDEYTVLSNNILSFSNSFIHLFDEQEEFIKSIGKFSFTIHFNDEIYFVQVKQDLLDALADFNIDDRYIPILCEHPGGIAFDMKYIDFSSIYDLGRIQYPCSIQDIGDVILIEYRDDNDPDNARIPRGIYIYNKWYILIRLIDERTFPSEFECTFTKNKHSFGKSNGDTDDEEPSDSVLIKKSGYFDFKTIDQ